MLVDTGEDHALLAREEIQAFELQHAEVGASICERWRMPQEIVVPIRFHERPTACPTEYSKTARCVGMANLIHAVLNAHAPSMPLARTYERAHSWFGISESRVDELISETGSSTRELAGVFDVKLDPHETPQELLARADRQLIELTRSSLAGSYNTRQVAEGEHAEGQPGGASGTDELTGVLDRQGFKHAIGQVYGTVKPGEIDVSIVQIAIEGLDEVRGNLGDDACDDIIVGIATILLRYFEPMGGAVCRVAERGFGIVLPEIEHEPAIHVSESVREEFSRAVGGWIPGVSDIGAYLKIHIGVATLNRDSARVYATPDKLVVASSEAVRRARAKQCSAVCGTDTHRSAAA